ncbi:hypothetical protein [Rathayibacter sp. VKM Ac-2927]|uniref:hypothetical protein n=1 Tax=Rathayibacter sp. VKM Ac-2927 TaxID=2929478 RepID=UPI001FB2838B|nr:hypothetical protein [Rathayibacter sp. VKM Ac-2927]MCJ1689081.1 hypothetical protein [Rathayibacter sp. VKM Ac-2927]
MGGATSRAGSSFERSPFDSDQVRAWEATHPRHRNCPVVYFLDSAAEVYGGESFNAEGRLRQHLDFSEKSRLERVQDVLDDTCNKSVWLDLESFLLRILSGEGRLTVLNHNAGIIDADYFDREFYPGRSTRCSTSAHGGAPLPADDARDR